MQPPKLVHQENYNGSVIISEGETLSLDCNAHGIPIPRIYWMYGKHAQSKFKQSNLSCESKIGFNASLLLNTYINSVCVCVFNDIFQIFRSHQYFSWKMFNYMTVESILVLQEMDIHLVSVALSWLMSEVKKFYPIF